MSESFPKNLALENRVKQWLDVQAFPTWWKLGVDHATDGFFEGISFQGDSLTLPRRSMVQARQIYCFRVARDLKWRKNEDLDPLLLRSIEKWIRCYRLPSGLFAHSANAMGEVVDPKTDLYNQAFVLFGLAQAFAMFRDLKYMHLARDVVQELKKNRSAPGGGFLEVGEAKWTYLANPHMHLFEGALAWIELDGSEIWRALADQILDLCAQKFVDVKSGALCESFSEGWSKVVGPHGFVYEPGHHYEWSWLLAWYESLTGGGFPGLQRALFEVAERSGVHSQRVVDEVWSDTTVKEQSSRYWPQCERVKASLRLASASHGKQKNKFLRSADEALAVLFTYLEAPLPGLCFDRFVPTDLMDVEAKVKNAASSPRGFSSQEPRASCFYHIVNAMHEYLNLRNREVF